MIWPISGIIFGSLLKGNMPLLERVCSAYRWRFFGGGAFGTGVVCFWKAGITGFYGILGRCVVRLSAFFGLGLLYYSHQMGVHGWAFGLL